ncbi:aspartate aminotransferase family protein [Candidatus Micrarchaeota archaeon]|nr:aspartate aminotransferase family protein [Candidatus Micrarchaeota archaeon]MBU1681422.1 aspartate aminotransferase family protein [Candidatus Micrarchaeota archaeon]
MGIKIVTNIPGKKSKVYLDKIKKLNIGWNSPYPFVQSRGGYGCYFDDIDGNRYLDFGSQICTNPLGYNHPDISLVLEGLGTFSPVKLAGQDFTVPEHLEMLEELIKITPGNLDSAMLVNSGAEAVENCIKLALRSRSSAKYGVSFESAFHGRTLGALSMTNSKSVHKKNILEIPTKRLPFDTSSQEKLIRLIDQEGGSEKIGFVIVEAIQGEGGYRVADPKMMKDLRKTTKQYDIPLICDEVQAGLGRTGKWWAYENFGIVPDIMSSAKALQIGAAIANKKKFEVDPGAISSTWGGGSIIDLAIGLQTIKTIKKRKLLENVRHMGVLLKKGLVEIAKEHRVMSNVRGIGLMLAFDVVDKKTRNSMILEMLKRGVVVLGTGNRGIRVIPSYIVGSEEIHEFLEVLDSALHMQEKKKVKHTGNICKYLNCGEVHS